MIPIEILGGDYKQAALVVDATGHGAQLRVKSKGLLAFGATEDIPLRYIQSLDILEGRTEDTIPFSLTFENGRNLIGRVEEAEFTRIQVAAVENAARKSSGKGGSMVLGCLLLFIGLSVIGKLMPDREYRNGSNASTSRKPSMTGNGKRAVQLFVERGGGFRDPGSLKFRWEGDTLYVNAKNGFGGYTGFKRYGTFPGASRIQWTPERGMK